MLISPQSASVPQAATSSSAFSLSIWLCWSDAADLDACFSRSALRTFFLKPPNFFSGRAPPEVLPHNLAMACLHFSSTLHSSYSSGGGQRWSPLRLAL